jgi:hypothetical protein
VLAPQGSGKWSAGSGSTGRTKPDLVVGKDRIRWTAQNGSDGRIDRITHYRDPEAFEQVHGVTDLGGTFLLVTGKQCHYLLRSPVAHICPHHDWSFCRTRAVETSATPISGPSVSPRAFFGAQEPYHCAHREVACIKATEVNGTNRELCGVRSAQNGGAFCEIFSFEQYLCCRMCVFEAACATAPAFKLPCEVSGDDCPL